jgi:hypothetical protein
VLFVGKIKTAFIDKINLTREKRERKREREREASQDRSHLHGRVNGRSVV